MDVLKFLVTAGSGDGSGDGSGSGSGSGSDSGSGYGYGSGSGSGSGDGYGSGYGSGDGDDIKTFCGNKVHYIDNIATIIKNIKGNIAKGYILNKDLTLTKTYIAKKGNYFAHAETIKKAVSDVVVKELANMNVDAKIDEFRKLFKEGVKYLGHEFFKWHGILTGSCEQGREHFVKENNIDLDSEFTIKEFVKMCENSYGFEIIKKLLVSILEKGGTNEKYPNRLSCWP